MQPRRYVGRVGAAGRAGREDRRSGRARAGRQNQQVVTYVPGNKSGLKREYGRRFFSNLPKTGRAARRPPSDRSRSGPFLYGISLREMPDRDGGIRYAYATRQRAARIVRAPVQPLADVSRETSNGDQRIERAPVQPLAIVRFAVYTVYK